jgi:hypothetical protein
LGSPGPRWTVVWRDNVKPADFAEWEAIVAAALEPYAGEFGVGFYETADGWTFTTGWRDLVGREPDGGLRASGDPSAIRRPIHQALTRAGKPLARDAHIRARDPDGSGDPGPPAPDEARRGREDPAAEDERFTDGQIDALSRIAVTDVHGALIRRLAAEVRALRDALKKAPSGAPDR